MVYKPPSHFETTLSAATVNIQCEMSIQDIEDERGMGMVSAPQNDNNIQRQNLDPFMFYRVPEEPALGVSDLKN